MALPHQDSFTAANGTALPTYNAQWIEIVGSYAINTNAVYSDDSASPGFAYWNEANDSPPTGGYNANQYAQMVNVAMSESGSGRMGVSVRCEVGSSPQTTCYYAWGRYNQGANNFEMGKFVNGVKTPLDSEPDFMVPTDLLRLEVEDETLTVKLNGNTIMQEDDSSIASGAAGIYSNNINTTGTRWDDLEVGNLGAPPVGLSIPIVMHHLTKNIKAG